MLGDSMTLNFRKYSVGVMGGRLPVEKKADSERYYFTLH